MGYQRVGEFVGDFTGAILSQGLAPEEQDMDFMETVSFESGAGHDSFLEGETLLDDTLPIARRKPPALVVVAPAEGAAVDPNLSFPRT